ncbi:hypothetical protein E1262_12905 [Jiangella aurantiaca]|uniref:Uncharacterized protein n=1 Tax=Jiangella aurantiaca TaxID=2530373 RepID=A0A4R5AB22_9ACTN|nr:hypothetical protein [Jiangella aurantiaca]TDD69533.1 hypothetical protein E1262_12905 [Jiangella aurantiaca]
MLPLHLLDEDAVEALLAGRPVTPGLAPLAGAVGQIRAAARQPVRPSAELAQRMASGDFSGIEPAPLIPTPAGRRLRSWLAGVSPRARVVTGAVVVFTGLSAATAAGALPGAAQARVESFIETVTPISFQRDAPDADHDDLRDTPPDRVRPTAEPDSGRPDDPGSPVTPPGKPETPPGKPETPGNPDRPETPPGKPETPPGKPETPPSKPETPPGKPETPGNPDQPEIPPPNRPETPPGHPESAPGRPEAPGQESGNGGGNSGNSGNSDNSNGNSGERPHGPDR